jgi:hypothetical protein
VSARLDYSQLCGLLVAAMTVVTIVLILTVRAGTRTAHPARTEGRGSTASTDGQ